MRTGPCSITHEHTPPDTLQYNVVAERGFRLLREKAITLTEELDDAINVPREKLWTQAQIFACEVIKMFATISTKGENLP